MKKVAVIGCGGAGKSTLSRTLSELMNIPVYHIDKLNWNPGWIPASQDALSEMINALVLKEEWIIDGNYSSTLDIRLECADTVIFLNMPTYLCFYRVLKRRIMYSGKSRPDMNEGCPEKIDLEFIKWIWGFNKNRRPLILNKLDKVSTEKDVFILSNPSEVDKFLDNLRCNKVQLNE